MKGTAKAIVQVEANLANTRVHICTIQASHCHETLKGRGGFWRVMDSQRLLLYGETLLLRLHERMRYKESSCKQVNSFWSPRSQGVGRYKCRFHASQKHEDPGRANSRKGLGCVYNLSFWDFLHGFSGLIKCRESFQAQEEFLWCGQNSRHLPVIWQISNNKFSTIYLFSAIFFVISLLELLKIFKQLFSIESIHWQALLVHF